MDRDITCQML